MSLRCILRCIYACDFVQGASSTTLVALKPPASVVSQQTFVDELESDRGLEPPRKTFQNRKEMTADFIATHGTPCEIAAFLVETTLFGPRCVYKDGPWPSSGALTAFKKKFESLHPTDKWKPQVRFLR